MKETLQKLTDAAAQLIETQKSLSAAISDAIDKIQSATEKINEAQALCRQLRAEVDEVRTKYREDVEPAILELCGAMTETNGALSKVFDSRFARAGSGRRRRRSDDES